MRFLGNARRERDDFRGVGKLLKNRYRRFNIDIQAVNPQDDFDMIMMRYIFSRKLSRGLKEGDLPDAMLIDNRRRQGIIKRRVGNFLKVSGSLQNRLNRRTRSRTGRRRGEIVLSRIC